MKQVKRAKTPTSDSPRERKPKISKAAAKIIERRKQNEIMLKQMERKIKGTAQNQQLITRNYEHFDSTNQKAKSENLVSNKVRYNSKKAGKGLNLPWKSNHTNGSDSVNTSSKPTPTYLMYSNNTSYSKEGKSANSTTNIKVKKVTKNKGTFNYQSDSQKLKK
jgi:hypothetical protein